MKSNNDVRRLLQELLETSADSGRYVTACELRDELLQHSELSQIDPKTLYYRVRDRLGRLEKMRLADRVAIEGSCRPVFQLRPALRVAEKPSNTVPNVTVETSDVIRQLNQDSVDLRAEMQRSLGMLEEYKDAIKGYPALRDRLRPLQKKETQRAHYLTGRLQGLTKMRQLLADAEKTP